MKQNFKHDCDKCKPLGETRFRSIFKVDKHFDLDKFPEDHSVYDLYYCDQGFLPSTVIARYGNNPHEYISGMQFAKMDISKPLVEALKRAQEKGLV